MQRMGILLVFPINRTPDGDIVSLAGLDGGTFVAVHVVIIVIVRLVLQRRKGAGDKCPPQGSGPPLLLE